VLKYALILTNVTHAVEIRSRVFSFTNLKSNLCDFFMFKTVSCKFARHTACSVYNYIRGVIKVSVITVGVLACIHSWR